LAKRVLTSGTRYLSDPSVGIFWRVVGVLVTNLLTLAVVESYGDRLTQPTGHYELCERWRGHGAARGLGFPDRLDRVRRRAAQTDRVRNADRRLQAPDIIAALSGLRTPRRGGGRQKRLALAVVSQHASQQ
jgi:hypothetical protein